MALEAVEGDAALEALAELLYEKLGPSFGEVLEIP